jgi:lipopolysaccharide export system protein LptC
MRFLRQIWDRLSIYLPVLLMGILALGTYWLVRSTPAPVAVTLDRPVSEDPDYLMERFSLKTFDPKGRLKSEVYGEKAKHYPRTDFLEIESVRIRSYNERGELTVATAQRAWTNGDASEVQLIGDAQVVREAMPDARGTMQPRWYFKSEFLHAFLNEERIKSHKPVELVRGDSRITAEGIEFSNIDQVLELRGRVRGLLMPMNKD